jgi:PadR family transcriptional regulator PadR
MSSIGLRVLNVFLENPRKALYGYDLMREVSICSGTLYPMLLRFEVEGLLSSEWEDVDASQKGRPRRRLYTITGSGQRIALEHLQHLRLQEARA